MLGISTLQNQEALGNPLECDMDEMRTWLERHKLGHLSRVFAEQAIELDVLGRLTDEDMKELGIALGDRYRLRAAIKGLEPRVASTPKAHFRHLTVVFSDLVDSTLLSVQLGPEEYRRALQSYQGAVADVMERYGGTITRYDGDGVLVLFGFPEAHEDDPDRAVRAGLDSVAAVSILPAVRETKLASRVGIATGLVVVGDLVGEGASRQVAVSGTTPNFASRLQGLAEPGAVIISETTHRLVTSKLVAEPLEPKRVKGIAEPVHAFLVKAAQESDRFAQHSAHGLTPLIARDVERDQLTRSWRAAQRGEGQITVISGEAGIGKSRVVNEFLADVPEHQVLRYFCLPRYQNSTLYPIVRQLHDAIGVEHELSQATQRARLAHVLNLNEKTDSRVLSVFEALLSFRTEDEEKGSARIDREQIVEAVSRQLAARGAKAPTVMIIEDLHWGDPTTLELLDRLVSWLAHQPIFIIATTRQDFIPALTDSRVVSIIKLIRLTHRESISFIDEVRQDRAIAPVDREMIAERCDGVPLYLEEVTRAALDSVDVSILERKTAGIPETLRDLLMARLDRLGTGSELAQTASVFGRQFSARQLRAVAGLSEAEVVRGLAALESAKIITQRDAVDEEVTYQFNHALTADAAYASMLDETKRRLHAKVARMLDADPNSAEREPETAAWHYESAGEFEPAIRLRELAGHRASARSANLESAHHFYRAVKLASYLPAAEKQLRLELRLRLELGTQLIACYGNGATQVETNFERARELCRLVSDKGMRWQALHGLRSCYLVRGRLHQAEKLGETLLELAGRLEGSGPLIQAHRAQGLCLFALGRFDQACEHLERAVELYDPELHRVQSTGFISDLLVLAKCHLGWLCCFLGQTERALTYHDEAIRYAERLSHQHSLAFALALAAASHQALEEPERTRSLSRRLMELSERRSYPYWLAWGRMLTAWALACTGEAGAFEEFDAGLRAYRETDARMMIPYFLTLRAEVDLARERYPEAIERLNEAEQLADETGTQFYACEISRLRAVAYSRTSEAKKARVAVDKATAIAREQGNVLLMQRVERTLAELNLPD